MTFAAQIGQVVCPLFYGSILYYLNPLPVKINTLLTQTHHLPSLPFSNKRRRDLDQGLSHLSISRPLIK
jgi:hypothetical protein